MQSPGDVNPETLDRMLLRNVFGTFVFDEKKSGELALTSPPGAFGRTWQGGQWRHTLTLRAFNTFNFSAALVLPISVGWYSRSLKNLARRLLHHSHQSASATP